MSPVLTQRVAGTSSGISRAVPSCQTQTLRSGTSAASSSRDSPVASGSSPAGVRRAAEQMVVPAFLPSAVVNLRVDGVDEVDASGAALPSLTPTTANGQPPLQVNPATPTMSMATPGCAPNAPAVHQIAQPRDTTAAGPCYVSTSGGQAQQADLVGCAAASQVYSPVAPLVPLQEDSAGLLESTGDIAHDGLSAATTFIPLIRAPPSPSHSSAPCSPSSSVVLSGACRSSVASATYRLTCSSAIDSATSCATNASFASASVSGPACASGSVAAAGTAAACADVPTDSCGSSSDGGCPLVKALLGPSDAFRQCFPDFAPAPSIQRRTAVPPPPTATANMNLQRYPVQPKSLEVEPRVAGGVAAATACNGVLHEHETVSEDVQPSMAGGAAAAAGGVPPLSFFTMASLSGCSSRRSSLRDQNSVTIKATTVVKDAAGAIDKILSRGVTALVTALRSGGPPYSTSYDSLNQAVKAIAVARQYAKETGTEGAEVTFLPFHRYDSNERADPCRFAFLVFPVPQLDERLKTVDETVLNVARGSDVHKMASAIIAVMLDRGQAVMKAAGSEAIFVAMSAVVNARHRLIQKHGFDLMLAAAWITEDTRSTMGRESKFLRFNVLKTEPAGPKSGVAPTLPALLEA